MDPTFSNYIQTLDSSLAKLLAMRPERRQSLSPQVPQQGVYSLSEGDDHLYVGRTDRGKNGMRDRILMHSRPSANDNTATFAFRLAREATRHVDASYRTRGSRKDLMADPVFEQAFVEAKKRIREMDVRYVEEQHPVRQALLEIYVAVALQARYNDFGTH